MVVRVDGRYDGEGMAPLGGWMELSDSSTKHNWLMTANDAHLAVICDDWVAKGVYGVPGGKDEAKAH